MSFPFVFSIAIAQLLGAFALVSGVIAVAVGIFGKHRTHRFLEIISGLIRIAAGIALFVCVASGVAVITLILAIFLIVEGVFLAATAFKLREHTGWVWTLVSGIASIVLGIMVYVRWPGDSAWVLGLLFGINMIFNGSSLIALGLGAPKRPAAAA